MNTPLAIDADLLRAKPLPVPHEGSKDDRGRLLVIGGSVEVPGAALLAGTAALRAGTGKLQIATVASLAPHLALAMPEALVIGCPQTAAGGIARYAAAHLAKKAGRCDAVLIGPGMVEEDEATGLTRDLLTDAPEVGWVLDAASLCGALSLADVLRSRGAPAVITPHAGEMATLMATGRDEVEADPLAAARSVSRALGAVVVMKGSHTHIVDPHGGAWIYTGGSVGLATSGSGDTLAGIIAGLMARGAAPVDASIWGVYLHGEAGRRLSQQFGAVGFLAREIPAEVPPLMHALTDR